MIYGLLGLILAIAVYGPYLWVKFVMWKHSTEIDKMPGTGGELAEHLLERFELSDVSVVRGKPGEDHYDPANLMVSLSPKNFDGKSVTAVAVAAHEVGHAVQFCRQEPVSQLRSKYLQRAFLIERMGSVLLAVLLMIAMFIRAPAFLILVAGVGIVTMLASALMYVAILPEEYDASFNKALPLLEEGYLPEHHIPAARQVLKAAAMTYVAGAFANIINLWRWIRFIR